MRDDSSGAGTVDRIRRHLVGLKMPRALEVLDHVLRQLERGEIGAPEALEMVLAEPRRDFWRLQLLSRMEPS